MRAAAQRGGFSLLEVLVGLAIFAIVVVPLINLELSSTAQVGRVTIERQAHYLAVYTLDATLSSNFHGEQTVKSGEFRIEVRSSALEKAQFPIERVTVQVYRNDETNGQATVTQNDEAYGEATAYRLRQSDQQQGQAQPQASGAPTAPSSR